MLGYPIAAIEEILEKEELLSEFYFISNLSFLQLMR
jgi:hypothetical protein